MQHDVGSRQQLGAAAGQQPGVAGAGTDQVDGHGATPVKAAASPPKPSTAAPPPASSARASSAPTATGSTPRRGHADHGAPVAAGHQPRHPQGRRTAGLGTGTARAVARLLGEGADRHGAAPPERGQHRPLGHEGTVARPVVHGAQQHAGRPVVGPALHGDGALPRLRQHVHRVEHVAQAVHPAETLHGGDGDHDGGDLLALAERHPPGHVAPQLGEDEVGPQVGQLGPAPGRARRHEGAGGQAGQRAADEAVAGVGPRRHRSEDEVLAP